MLEVPCMWKHEFGYYLCVCICLSHSHTHSLPSSLSLSVTRKRADFISFHHCLFFFHLSVPLDHSLTHALTPISLSCSWRSHGGWDDADRRRRSRRYLNFSYFGMRWNEPFFVTHTDIYIPCRYRAWRVLSGVGGEVKSKRGLIRLPPKFSLFVTAILPKLSISLSQCRMSTLLQLRHLSVLN